MVVDNNEPEPKAADTYFLCSWWPHLSATAPPAELLLITTRDPSGQPIESAWQVAAPREAEVDIVVVASDGAVPAAALVDAVVSRLASDPSVDAAVPAVAVPRAAALGPDVVTVARGDDGTARFFSRSVVPWGADTVLRTVGVEAYRWDALRRLSLAAPADLEVAEGLTLLRGLEIGLRIAVVEVERDRPGDDADADADADAAVRLVVLDVDGVLADGRISYLADGAQLVSFDAKDGEGIKALKRAGIDVAVVTARDSPALRHRVAELGIAELRTMVTDKAAEVSELAALFGVPLRQVCYVGDDVGDVAAMSLCGRSAAPSDAMPAARRQATIALGRPGGRGAVRELADLLLGG